jgi:Ca-activated chloride channel family protein
MDYLEKGRHQRKALVILSDGGDNASTETLDTTLHRLQASDATVYTIGIYDPRAKDKNPDVLKKIAKQVAGGIRTQYTLGFTSENPSQDGSFRRVQIRAAGKDGKSLRVRAREGYRAAAPQ